jgi:hypothetical protein
MEPDDNAPPDGGSDTSLDGLLSEATMLEGAGQVKSDQAAQAAAVDTITATAAELNDALQLARALAAPTMSWWPQFGEVWSDKALSAIAMAGAQVMQRHGWTMAETWAKLGPYIALVGALAPPSLVTWQAVKQHQAQARALELQRQRQGGQAVMPASQGAAGQTASNAP